MMQVSQGDAINRWRLVLGGLSDRQLAFAGEGIDLQTLMEMEQLLDFLYERAQDEDAPRQSGTGGSILSAAEWITKVRKLFPKSTTDVLERHALEEFHLTELITDKEVLEKLEPNLELLQSILQLKHLMQGEVLQTAKRIAKQVAEELRKQLEDDVRHSILGKLDRNTSSPVHSARNLDIRKTIRRNLKHYDSESRQLVLQDVYFSNRVKRYCTWRVIIAIDESGSMVGSVIYSAVMAQILAQLPFTDVKLVIFDTNVVDLSAHIEDPAEILMSVQLSGGTDIGKALRYCEALIDTPHRTCVFVVTDLYEGAPEKYLLNTSRNILESGAKLNFLTALDKDANPAYDRRLGQILADMGAFVGAMTPDQLGQYIGKMLSS